MDENSEMKKAIQRYGHHWNAVNGCEPDSFGHMEAFCLSRTISEATGLRQMDLMTAIESYVFINGSGNSLLFLDDCAEKLCCHIEEKMDEISYGLPYWEAVADRMYA